MKEDIRLNGKEVTTIQVNKQKKLVTVVSNDPYAMSFNELCRIVNMLRKDEGRKPLEYEPKPEKVVTISNPVKDDEFDPYIGVALALAYNLFGSKTKFRKYVKEEILKEKEEVKKAINEVKTSPTAKEYLYGNHTLQQLRDMARDHGLKGYSKLTKSELVDFIFDNITIHI